MDSRVRGKDGRARAGLLLLLLLLVPSSGALAQAPAGPPTVALELLSDYSLPAGFRFAETCVGGLSAIFHDAPNDRYFALSDSRRDARFYVLRVRIEDAQDDAGGPRIAEVVFERVVRLLTREGLPYPDGRVDPEGFTLVAAGAAYVSSEGVSEDGVPPFVDLVDVDSGEWLATAPVPLAFKPRRRGDEQVQGVRRNLGFESLTSCPDRRHLVAATESALAQDASGLAPEAEHFARLLRWELSPTPALAAQALYPLTAPDGRARVHGLVELLALDDGGRFLALERTWGPEIGLAVKLFEFDLGAARVRDASPGASPPPPDLPVISKRPVLDFAQLPILLANFEGLSFGPRLADGSESLLVLGDNNNTDCEPPTRLSDVQPTRLLLFRMKR